jgi:hypothetical protein
VSPSKQIFFEPGSQQAEHAMSTLVSSSSEIPWWKEPTKDQWIAWIAAWLGWTLDAFDFTIFLLIMVPIAESFKVPLIEVTAVFTVTLCCGWWVPSAPDGSPIASDARRR